MKNILKKQEGNTMLFRKGKWVLNTFVLITISLTLLAQDYQPPIGIPAPEFGINESHIMYLNSQYDFGNGLESYKNAGNGPYTHYVDNTAANCSNSNNEYGSSTTPRCTLPKTPGLYAAGSVVEIHGGPYDYGGFQNIIANGTALQPVFIRGINTGENRVRYIGTQLRIAGEYLIIENLEMYNNNARISISRNWDAQNRSNFISFRNSEVHKPVNETGNSNGVAAGGDDIVIFNNEIHHNIRSTTQDAHGVVVSTGSNRTWILENNIYNNSGNGIQACHNCNPAPRFIYIGKNEIHDDRELAIGLKYAEDVIISQNKMWGYNDGGGTSTPTGIVVGAAGATIRVWMLFNEIFDCTNGIRIEETPTDTWIIGNLIHDITNVGINLEKESLDTYVINNTFNNVGIGINQTWREFFVLKAFNNIFSNIGTYPINITRTNVSDFSEASNNMFSQNGNAFPIRWEPSNTNYTTTTDFSTFPGGSNNIVGNPDFVPSTLEIGLNSDAIDFGLSSGDAVFAYTQFENMYGLNIMFDFNGVPRSLDGDWDIGAYELNAELIFTNGFEINN